MAAGCAGALGGEATSDKGGIEDIGGGTGHGMETKRFSHSARAGAMRAINAHIAGWPYSRPVGEALFRYWDGMSRLQPDNMLIRFRNGEPRAFLHGEFRDADTAMVYLLAAVPGAADDAAYLLEEFESSARAAHISRIIGPNHSGGIFYGGYILGLEPFHPHWSTDVTEVFLRARFRMVNPAVMLTRSLEAGIALDPPPAGYEIVPMAQPSEFEAIAFGYRAVFRGAEVARCGARVYKFLRTGTPDGGMAGQIGPVSTDEEHRCKGLARIMTLMCARDMRMLGASEALVTTSLENLPALRAYERAGFRRRHFLMEWAKDL